MAATYVTMQELRDSLGIGTLYSNATVEEVCQSAQDLINKFLWFDEAQVLGTKLESNVATLQVTNSTFRVGDVITVSGSGSVYNGSQTVTGLTTGAPWPFGIYPAVTTAPYSFITFAKVNADLDFHALIPYGSALGADTKTATYALTPLVREAAMITAVDIWQARQVAQTGQSLDGYSPSPYRMGNSLIGKVRGLLSPYISPNTLVG